MIVRVGASRRLFLATRCVQTRILPHFISQIIRFTYRLKMVNDEQKTDIVDKDVSPLLLKLARSSCRLSVLLLIAGYAATFGIVWPSLHNPTYFSENALLPGLVKPGFTHSYNDHMMTKTMHHLNGVHKASPDAPMWPHIESLWLGAGIEAHSQHFSVIHPNGKVVNGTNVYAIVRAGRAQSTEAMLLCARADWQHLHTVSMLHALAHYYQRQIYWARDIIIVTVEHGAYGMKAFLQQYVDGHMRSSDDVAGITAERLRTRGGAIVGGLCVDPDVNADGQFTRADVVHTMLDGKMPNLDLVNLVVKLAFNHMLMPTVHMAKEPHFNELFTTSTYQKMLRTAFDGLYAQAVGGIHYTGRLRPKSADTTMLHSVCGAYSIDVVTLRPYRSSRSRAELSWADIAQVVEGVSRSLNNVLERLHQSFFFYYLPSPFRYISIGDYMPGIGCFIGAILVQAVALWVRWLRESSKGNSTNVDNVRAEDQSMLSLIPYILLVHALGAILHLCVAYALASDNDDKVMRPLQIAVAFHVLPYILASRLNASTTKASPVTPLHFVCLLHVAATIGVISLFNYALAVAIAFVATPLCLLTQPIAVSDDDNAAKMARNTVRRLLVNVALIAAHPFIVCALWYAYWHADAIDPLSTVLPSLRHAFDCLRSIYSDYLVLGSVTFPWLLHALMPCHTFLALIANAQTQCHNEKAVQRAFGKEDLEESQQYDDVITEIA